jgi:hypothetical protein
MKRLNRWQRTGIVLSVVWARVLQPSVALHQTLSFVSVCRHLFDPLLTRTRRPSPGQLKSFLCPSA